MSKNIKSTDIDKEYAKQLELMHWIDANCRVPLLLNPSETLSHTCFDLAIEHYAAICTLSTAKLYGSMFSLLRILFESCVRGLWLHYCANQKQVKEYASEKLNISFRDMIESVESSAGVESGPLSSLKQKSWKLMNSFTHSGFQHHIRRNVNGVTGTINYDPAEVCSALNLAGWFGLLSAIELASFSGKEELVAKFLKKAQDYAGQ